MNQHKNKKIQCVPAVCVMCGSPFFTVNAQGKDYEYRTSDQIFHFVSCTACGHEYLNPRPADHCIGLAYPANYYTLSGRHTSRQSAIIARFKSFVVSHRLGFFKGLLKGKVSVLEVGCGDGALLIDLKKTYPGLNVFGLDMSLSADTVRRCAELGIPLIRTAVEQADYGVERFDLIIMNQVIEHVADPVTVVKTLASWLKPGGYITMETPDKAGYDRRLFYQSFWGGYYFPRHLHLFDRESLKALVEKADLQVVRQYSLLAPIIWIFSFHALVCDGLRPGKKKDILSWFFSDKNPVCLGMFTVVDLLARLSGFSTSNQKIIARKKTF